MSALNIAALALFAICWLFYQPLLKLLSRGGGAINTDMAVIRRAWMRTGRDARRFPCESDQISRFSVPE